MTEVATTKSATTNEELVTMADGRIVAFTPKRKVVKESFIANDAATGEASIQVRLDFRNGETRLFTIPAGLLHKFAAHGAEQKLGDAMSGLASVEDGVKVTMRPSAIVTSSSLVVADLVVATSVMAFSFLKVVRGTPPRFSTSLPHRTAWN